MTLASDLSSRLPQSPGAQRVSVVGALLSGPVGRLPDIGSGRVAPDYPYLDLAERITCVDGNPRITPLPPQRSRCAPETSWTWTLPRTTAPPRSTCRWRCARKAPGRD